MEQLEEKDNKKVDLGGKGYLKSVCLIGKLFMTNQEPITERHPVIPTEEQFSKRMREAYSMLGSCSTIEDISAPGGPLSHMFKDTIEVMLKAEMTDHLGYSGPHCLDHFYSFLSPTIINSLSHMS